MGIPLIGAGRRRVSPRPSHRVSVIAVREPDLRGQILHSAPADSEQAALLRRQGRQLQRRSA